MEDVPVSLTEIDFKNLFKALPGLYLVLSPELFIIEASNSYQKATHATDKDIKGKYLFDVFPENPNLKGLKSSEILEASILQVIESKKPHVLPVLRYDVENATGEYEEHYWHMHTVPILDTAGNLKQVLHEVRNITGKVKAEKEAEAVQQNLKLMSKAAGGIVWECDLIANKINWSESYKEVLGYSDSSLKAEAQVWDELVHPDDYPKVRDSIEAVIANKQKFWTGEYRYRNANGTYTDIVDHGYVIYDHLGKPERLLGSMVDVSRQKTHEQELQKSQERFMRIAMATNDVIWDWDLEDDSIWWNEGFKTLFGYTEKDIEPTSISWTNRVHPDDLPHVNETIYDVINSGNTNWEHEYRFRCADGSYKLVIDRGYVIHSSNGKAIRMVGAMVDITEKKQFEQQLQETTNWSVKIMESLPLMVWTAASDGAINYINQRWTEYTGSTLQEMKDWRWENFTHPEDFKRSSTLWSQCLKTGEPYVNQSRWKSGKDGTYRWFLARAVPIRNSLGEVTLWVGSHTDIEDQKQLQIELQRATHRFQFLAESIPQMVWTTLSDGFHDYFNQHWVNYTGLTLEESLGMKWIELLHPDDRQHSWNRWQYSLRTGDFYEVEYRLRNGSNGPYRWFLGRAMAMRDEKGNIVKWFGTCTDIEDHKRAEEELVAKNLELERINQDLDSFVYTASHDLKLPIINMAGIFEALNDTATYNDPDAPRMIEMFNKSLQQIHNTIHDLAEVVKIQKSQDSEVETVDLTGISNDVIVSLQDFLADSGAQVITDFSAAPTVPFTRANMKSILYNLISNALKYRAHDRTPQVSLSTEQKGNYIELKVQDNGLGIDMNKHQSKLFQMFKRFHNHVPGSGLGLYIVNRLLTNQGGYINIESKLDEGTTFYLYFRLKKT
ncbi:PAS domain-containing protein [Pontibacter silvestris]|uniref:histidine kinase n=1 Tax=Pontibacter silvestris TaxID=2305183 RepID=A0ABW4X3Y8_9BACT|nr:PAS domain-containing protein [Pontibacter silvestris]MCC9137159.1 PAS domain-containing protein [Pontibacter silvestris]